MDVISQETTNQNYLRKTQWKPFWRLCKIAMKVQHQFNTNLISEVYTIGMMLLYFTLLYTHNTIANDIFK